MPTATTPICLSRPSSRSNNNSWRCRPRRGPIWTPPTAARRAGKVIEDHNLIGQVSAKGVPAPIPVGKRWLVARSQSWVNGYGKIRRCFERDSQIVGFYLYLAAAFDIVRVLIREDRTRYR